MAAAILPDLPAASLPNELCIIILNRRESPLARLVGDYDAVVNRVRITVASLFNSRVSFDHRAA